MATSYPANTVQPAPELLGVKRFLRPLVPITLALSDVLIVTLITLFAVYLRRAVFPNLFGLDPFSPVRNYITLWPVLGLLLLVRILFGLYPGYGLHPAEELRRQTVSSFILIFFVLAGSALFQFATVYSRTVLIFAALLVLLLLPLTRATLKHLLAHLPFYGSPIWILGASERASQLERVIGNSPALGFRVVGSGSTVPGEMPGLHYCLLVPEGLTASLEELLDTLNQRFRHVWLVPNLLDVASVWITPRDLQGHLALELHNNLLEFQSRIIKRGLDIFLVFVSLPLTLPLCLLLGLWVKLDSAGGALFGHLRVGSGDKPFKVWKFRTMRLSAERELEEHLNASAEAREEWELTRKLRCDPRVTRSGSFLRRSSLDELPQLWNVLKGEMSLVGPRPVMSDELTFYGDKAPLYTRVKPGITGLWQVSGRSTLNYDERIRLDSYYVRNWSLWLDLVIISQTFAAIIRNEGAY